MPADSLLLRAGLWLGVAGGVLLLLTVSGFLARWGIRFRLVGVTSFTLLLAVFCWAFAISYSPRQEIAGAVRVPVVFDNGAGLVVAAAPADLPREAVAPTLEQLARNLRGGGRASPDGLVHIRLRRLEPVAPGTSRPVIVAEATRDLVSGDVSLTP